VLFNRTNATDDQTCFLLDGGDPNGQIYMEGLNLSGANGVTVRTKRKVVIQNSRIEVWTWNYQDQNIHPDIVQVWGADASHVPCKGIYMNKVTGITAYSGLVCLVEKPPAGSQVDPLEWACDEVNLKPHVRPNGNKDAGNYAYQCSGPTGQANGPFCVHKGNVYAELPTGGGGAYTRPIDGIVILKYIGSSGNVYFPYEIHKADGTTVYTSPAAPTGGNGPLAETQKAGNYLTFERVPQFVGRRWYIGAPPGGDFCKAGVPGPNYVSPGYL
jgi:hypothetical protein